MEEENAAVVAAQAAAEEVGAAGNEGADSVDEDGAGNEGADSVDEDGDVELVEEIRRNPTTGGNATDQPNVVVDPTPEPNPKRYKSPIWNHFKKLADPTIALCNHCNAEVCMISHCTTEFGLCLLFCRQSPSHGNTLFTITCSIRTLPA